MKHYILLIFSALALFSNAQDFKKMSPYVREIVRENSLISSAKGVFHNTTPTPSLVVFVKAESEAAVSKYCLRHQGNIHICKVPVNELASLSENTQITRIEAKQSDATALLQRTAQQTNAISAWQGIDMPTAFKGNGTVVGVIDCGIDFLHPTFRSKEDGRLRIVRAWDMIDYQEGQTSDDNKNPFPLGTFFNTEEGILKKGSTIDSDIAFHGTHTTSTAAGSGADKAYSGMAPEADIYSVCKYLGNNKEKIKEEYRKYYTDAVDMLAYQNIFDYADTIGKPCVINCSFGGNQDMTDADMLMNEYFNEITGPGHIIVASAGNDGTQACYMPKSADTKSIGGRISGSGSSIVINVSTRGKLKMHITDYSKGAETRKTYDLDFLPGNEAEQSPTGLKWYDFVTLLEDEENDLYLEIYSGNNEFDPTYVGYDIFLVRKDKKFNTNIYTIEFEGDGVAAEIFSQKCSLLPATQYSPTLTGALPNSGNVNSPASLPSVICVGSVTYNKTWTDYKGSPHTWDTGNIGERSSFSSCGPAQHVVIKPEVMAPGAAIAAAMSDAYYKTGKNDTRVIDFTEQDGVKYPWAIEGGTSMSSPVVAGIIALWLEADPTLTKEKIMDVIEHTSKQTVSGLSYPNTQYGYGEIDAYKGLLYVLNMSGIDGLSEKHLDKSVSVVPQGDGTITITLSQESTTTLPVRIYNTGGQLLFTTAIAPGSTTATIPASQLHGIIAVQVGNLGSTLIKK
ncbi:MAG: S8 family serine peptidase [Prevotella sp.]|nr:S8 family serine peptidase [Candidatus Prevotella equi]